MQPSPTDVHGAPQDAPKHAWGAPKYAWGTPLRKRHHTLTFGCTC